MLVERPLVGGGARIQHKLQHAVRPQRWPHLELQPWIDDGHVPLELALGNHGTCILQNASGGEWFWWKWRKKRKDKGDVYSEKKKLLKLSFMFQNFKYF